MNTHAPLPFPECAGPNPDAVYAGLRLDGSRDKVVVRVVQELCLYESVVQGKPLNREAANRIRQMLGLMENQPLPEITTNFLRNEWSRICNMRLGPFVSVRLLAPSKTVLLPVKAFTEETRMRVYSHLASQIAEAINATREEYKNLLNPDRHIQRYSEMHEALGRQFGVRVEVAKEDRISSLQASLSDARQEFEDAKARWQAAEHSDGGKNIERRLKMAQQKMNALSAELQKLRRPSQ